MILHNICCFILFVFAQAGTVPTATAEKATLQDDFSAIMQEIRQKSPVLYRQLQNKPRKQMLSAIFRALDSGVKTDEDFRRVNTVVKPQRKTQNFCGLLPDKRLLYYRMDRLDDSGMRDALQKYHSVAALILDLRTASGNEYDRIMPLLDLLQNRKMPIAVLTGHDINGASALFAAMAGRKKMFFTMGQAGQGYLFPTIQMTHSHITWHIPLMEEKYAAIPPEGVKPQLFYKTGKRITETALRNAISVSNDSLLTFAGDFLISRLVLSLKK